MVTGDNWLLYLMLLLTQPSQPKHLLVSEADEDRCLFPRLWRDTVARRLEQWTGVDEVFPRGQPSRRCEVALEERSRWSVSSPKPLDCFCPDQTEQGVLLRRLKRDGVDRSHFSTLEIAAWIMPGSRRGCCSV